MELRRKSPLILMVKLIAACAVAAAIYYVCFSSAPINVVKNAEANTRTAAAIDTARNNAPSSGTTVNLTESQLTAFKIEFAVTHIFRVEKEAVGNIVYHEKDAGEDKHADKTSKFLVANVLESDSPLIHVGQPVKAKMLAYPDRVFDGKISALGVTVYDSGGNPALDPNTHRITARCEIVDPKNELYPGMLATIVIEVRQKMESVAIPKNGVVREGDGTMTVWVTSDRRHFEKRTVKIGLQQDGYDQILDGVKLEELVVTDNAVFLSNMNNTETQ